MRSRRGSFDLNSLGIRGILLIIAIICFVISAFAIVAVSRVDLTAVGLAFFAAAFLFE